MPVIIVPDIAAAATDQHDSTRRSLDRQWRTPRTGNLAITPGRSNQA